MPMIERSPQSYSASTNMTTIEAYWLAFLAELPPDSAYRQRHYAADSFGDSPGLADELGELIAAGVKTATCSALWEYEADGEPLPAPGQLTIVLNGGGMPLCIIETTEVEIRRFDQVDERFAYEEGEGDRSLAYWRRVHTEFFTRTLPRIGRKMDETMPLVCERFKVVEW